VELILVIAGAFFLYLVWRTQLASITIFEYERGLRFVRGRLRSELGAGLYRYVRAYTVIRKVDTRPVQLPVNGQEVLSKDGVAVKVSLSAGYRVTDARAATLNADNYITALYTELQQALRAAVSASEVETLLQNRAQVVKARQEGLAALERARGETAALRNLANAAQMVQRNPQLLQLRLLQVAGQQTGTTLVIGMPQGATPIPLREGAADVEALPTEGQTDKPAE